MPARRPRQAKRDPEKVDSLIGKAVDDSPAAAATPGKTKRKVGKSRDPRYTKSMLYLQADVQRKLAEKALDTPGKDMSDLVNKFLCEVLGVELLE